jgi:HD-like signal output (HDOD) protein
MTAYAKTLPSSPIVMQQLTPLLQDSNSGLEPFLELLKTETRLAARVIHAANSPFYSFKSTCDSIEEAVKRIGYADACRLSMLILAVELHGRPLRVYGLSCQQIWNECISVALAAQHLSAASGEPDANRAYTLGLLHNVGMVGIDLILRDKAPGFRLTRRPWPDLWRPGECAILGYDQADAGAAMIRHWRFPQKLVEAIRNQMRPDLARVPCPMASVLYVARWISYRLFNGQESPPPPSDRIMDVVGLQPEELDRILGLVRKEMDRTWRQLGLGSVDWEAVGDSSPVAAP